MTQPRPSPAANPPPLPYAAPPIAQVIPVGPGLSPEQLRQLADAKLAAKKVRRAIGVATFDGWATAIFAGVTLLSAAFSWIAIPLGLGMGIVAFVEFKGAAKLRRLDASATKALALNQVFLGAVLLSYAIYSLWQIYHDPSFLGGELASNPDVAGMLGHDMDYYAHLIGWSLYGTLAAVAIFGQGGTALYYFTRRSLVERYVQQTAPWILDAQRAGVLPL